MGGEEKITISLHQAVEGNQILHNQAGQKMTLEAGRA